MTDVDEDFVDEQDDIGCKFGHTWQSWVQTDCPDCQFAREVAEFFDHPYVKSTSWGGIAFVTRRIFADEIHAVMVGDDQVHVLDDAELLGELEFCHECGQIGCTHDGLER